MGKNKLRNFVTQNTYAIVLTITLICNFRFQKIWLFTCFSWRYHDFVWYEKINI